MDKKEFSPIEIDAIGEISNICLGNSASTLNMLVREKIDITPPRVEIIEKSEYIKEVSSKRVFVKVNYVEGLRGCSILMLEEQDAKAERQKRCRPRGVFEPTAGRRGSKPAKVGRGAGS